MHDYTTIIGVIELRSNQISYDKVQKRYRIGRSGITLIMNRFKESGLALDDLKHMSPEKSRNSFIRKKTVAAGISPCRISSRSIRR